MEIKTYQPGIRKRDQVRESLKDNTIFLISIVAILWGIEILDFLFRGHFDQYGVKPRYFPGLIGIVTAPWLHLGFGHLISNTVPFLILGGIVLVGGRNVFVAVSLFIVFVGGAALWLLGPSNTNHIGASSVIFGYLGFLMFRGIFERSGFWFAVSIAIAVLYGGMIFGVLPGRPEVSWQGHFFGFLAGILAARVLFSKQQSVYNAY